MKIVFGSAVFMWTLKIESECSASCSRLCYVPHEPWMPHPKTSDGRCTQGSMQMYLAGFGELGNDHLATHLS